MNMNKMAFSIDEAAKLCGLGRTKIYEAINLGDLKAKKYGKRTVILKADLEEFLQRLGNYCILSQK